MSATLPAVNHYTYREEDGGGETYYGRDQCVTVLTADDEHETELDIEAFASMATLSGHVDVVDLRSGAYWRANVAVTPGNVVDVLEAVMSAMVENVRAGLGTLPLDS